MSVNPDGMSLSDLESIVKDMLEEADMPADHRYAFVLVATTANEGTAKGVFVSKFNDVWSLDTYVSVGRTAPLEAGVVLKASW